MSLTYSSLLCPEGRQLGLSDLTASAAQMTEWALKNIWGGASVS
jgi:hypothetical protein